MSHGRITLEDAARAMLGHEDDGEQETSNRGVRPPSKITLPAREVAR
jgi:hypothetical protein